MKFERYFRFMAKIGFAGKFKKQEIIMNYSRRYL